MMVDHDQTLQLLGGHTVPSRPSLANATFLDQTDLNMTTNVTQLDEARVVGEWLLYVTPL